MRVIKLKQSIWLHDSYELAATETSFYCRRGTIICVLGTLSGNGFEHIFVITESGRTGWTSLNLP